MKKPEFRRIQLMYGFHKNGDILLKCKQNYSFDRKILNVIFGYFKDLKKSYETFLKISFFQYFIFIKCLPELGTFFINLRVL